VAVVLTLVRVQTKQIRINIHKGNPRITKPIHTPTHSITKQVKITKVQVKTQYKIYPNEIVTIDKRHVTFRVGNCDLFHLNY